MNPNKRDRDLKTLLDSLPIPGDDSMSSNSVASSGADEDHEEETEDYFAVSARRNDRTESSTGDFLTPSPKNLKFAPLRRDPGEIKFSPTLDEDYPNENDETEQYEESGLEGSQMSKPGQGNLGNLKVIQFEDSDSNDSGSDSSYSQPGSFTPSQMAKMMASSTLSGGPSTSIFPKSSDPDLDHQTTSPYRANVDRTDQSLRLSPSTGVGSPLIFTPGAIHTGRRQEDELGSQRLSTQYQSQDGSQPFNSIRRGFAAYRESVEEEEDDPLDGPVEETKEETDGRALDEIQKLRLELSQYKIVLKTCEEEKLILHNEVENLRAFAETCQTERITHEHQMQDFQEHIALLQQKYGDQSDLAVIRGRALDNARMEINQLRGYLDARDRRIAELQFLLSENTQKESLFERAKEVEMENLHLEIDQKKILIHSYTKQIEELNSMINNQRERENESHQDASARIEELSRGNAQLLAELEKCKIDIADKAAEISQLEVRLRESNSVVEDIQAQKHLELQELQKANDEIRELQNQINIYKNNELAFSSGDADVDEQITKIKDVYERKSQKLSEENRMNRRIIDDLENTVKRLQSQAVEAGARKDTEDESDETRDHIDQSETLQFAASHASQASHNHGRLDDGFMSELCNLLQCGPEHQEVLDQVTTLKEEAETLEMMKNEYEKMSERLMALSEQEESWNHLEESLRHQITSLREKLEEVQGNVRSIEETPGSNGSAEAASEELYMLRDKNWQLTQGIQQLEIKMKNATETIKVLESELESLAHQKDTSERLGESLAREVQDLTTRMNQISQKELNSEVDEDRDEEKDREEGEAVVGLRHQLIQKNAVLQQSEQEIEALNVHTKQLKIMLEASFSSIEQFCEVAMQFGIDCEELRQGLQRIDMLSSRDFDSSEIHCLLSSVNQFFNQVRGTLNESRGEVQDLEDRCQMLREANERLRGDIDGLKSTTEDLQERLLNVECSREDSLEDDESNQNGHGEASFRDSLRLEQDAELKDLRSTVEDKTQELSDLQNQLTTVTRALNEQLASASNENKSIRRELETTRSEISNLNSIITKKEAQNKVKDEQINEMDNISRRLIEENTTNTTQIDSLNQQNISLKDQITQLTTTNESNIGDFTEKIGDLEAKIGRMDTNLTTLTTENVGFEAENKRLMKEIDDLMAENQRLEGELVKVNEVLSQTKQDLRWIESVSKSGKNDEDIEAMKAQYENKLKEKQADLEVSEKKLQEFADQIEEAQKQLLVVKEEHQKRGTEIEQEYEVQLQKDREIKEGLQRDIEYLQQQLKEAIERENLLRDSQQQQERGQEGRLDERMTADELDTGEEIPNSETHGVYFDMLQASVGSNKSSRVSPKMAFRGNQVPSIEVLELVDRIIDGDDCPEFGVLSEELIARVDAIRENIENDYINRINELALEVRVKSDELDTFAKQDAGNSQGVNNVKTERSKTSEIASEIEYIEELRDGQKKLKTKLQEKEEELMTLQKQLKVERKQYEEELEDFSKTKEFEFQTRIRLREEELEDRIEGRYKQKYSELESLEHQKISKLEQELKVKFEDYKSDFLEEIESERDRLKDHEKKMRTTLEAELASMEKMKESLAAEYVTKTEEEFCRLKGENDRIIANIEKNIEEKYQKQSQEEINKTRMEISDLLDSAKVDFEKELLDKESTWKSQQNAALLTQKNDFVRKLQQRDQEHNMEISKLADDLKLEFEQDKLTKNDKLTEKLKNDVKKLKETQRIEINKLKIEHEKEKRKLKEESEYTLESTKKSYELSELEKISAERKEFDKRYKKKMQLLEHKHKKDLEEERTIMQMEYENLNSDVNQKVKSEIKKRESVLLQEMECRYRSELEAKVAEKEKELLETKSKLLEETIQEQEKLKEMFQEEVQKKMGELARQSISTMPSMALAVESKSMANSGKVAATDLPLSLGFDSELVQGSESEEKKREVHTSFLNPQRDSLCDEDVLMAQDRYEGIGNNTLSETGTSIDPALAQNRANMMTEDLRSGYIEHMYRNAEQRTREKNQVKEFVFSQRESVITEVITKLKGIFLHVLKSFDDLQDNVEKGDQIDEIYNYLFENPDMSQSATGSDENGSAELDQSLESLKKFIVSGFVGLRKGWQSKVKEVEDEWRGKYRQLAYFYNSNDAETMDADEINQRRETARFKNATTEESVFDGVRPVNDLTSTERCSGVLQEITREENRIRQFKQNMVTFDPDEMPRAGAGKIKNRDSIQVDLEKVVRDLLILQEAFCGVFNIPSIDKIDSEISLHEIEKILGVNRNDQATMLKLSKEKREKDISDPGKEYRNLLNSLQRLTVEAVWFLKGILGNHGMMSPNQQDRGAMRYIDPIQTADPSRLRVQLNNLRDRLWNVEKEKKFLESELAGQRAKIQGASDFSRTVGREEELDVLYTEVRQLREALDQKNQEMVGLQNSLAIKSNEFTLLKQRLEKIIRDRAEEAALRDFKGTCLPEMMSPNETIDLIIDIFRKSNRDSVVVRELKNNLEFLSLLEDFSHELNLSRLHGVSFERTSDGDSSNRLTTSPGWQEVEKYNRFKRPGYNPNQRSLRIPPLKNLSTSMTQGKRLDLERESPSRMSPQSGHHNLEDEETTATGMMTGDHRYHSLQSETNSERANYQAGNVRNLRAAASLSTNLPRRPRSVKGSISNHEQGQEWNLSATMGRNQSTSSLEMAKKKLSSSSSQKSIGRLVEERRSLINARETPKFSDL